MHTIQWTPAHAEDGGNEIADLRADGAAESQGTGNAPGG